MATTYRDGIDLHLDLDLRDEHLKYVHLVRFDLIHI